MATIYLKGNRWYIAWRRDGEKFQEATGLSMEEKGRALELKNELERRLKLDDALEKSSGVSSRVFAGYRKQWIRDRETQEVGSVKDDENWLSHARELDRMNMADIRPRHIRDVVLRLRREKKLAPRSIRHVFGTLRKLFNDAFVEELITANPCVVQKGVLPGKNDKDPTWRAQAVFTHAEACQLISDPSIPEQRRTIYALVFLTGMRIGEVSALRWHSYEAAKEPLGRLLVAASYSRAKKKVKGVKTEQPRQVPVHPALAKVLASWRLGGWARLLGRAPKEDDLLIPTGVNTHLKSTNVREYLQEDLAMLGFRPRRTHDARRTFISLALSDGARKDILKWVTHGGSGDIMDSYTTITWPALCAEVTKLNIRLVESTTVSLLPTNARTINE